jgi:hypothetical protein
MVREPDATVQPTPQDNQLMSKHRVLSFKPQRGQDGQHETAKPDHPELRLEWRGQDGLSETEQPDHSASLGDSITSSTRIEFSVQTGHFGRYHRPSADFRLWGKAELRETWTLRAAKRIKLGGNPCGAGDQFEGAQPSCVIVDIGHDHELVGTCFRNERIHA